MNDLNTKVPYIPSDAPFSGEQKVCLGGFVAGLHSRLATGGNAVAPTTQSAELKYLDVLLSAQTGNEESLAEDAAAMVRMKGFEPRLAEMGEVEMDQLAAMQNLIVVVSTYGEGEIPDNAHHFWDMLSETTAPRLEKLNYGLRALGDTS